jgi:hypothetical protein
LIGSFSLLEVLMLVIDALSSSRITSTRDQMVDITERRMTAISTREKIRGLANWTSPVSISTPKGVC